jgi:hypothetical protein
MGILFFYVVLALLVGALSSDRTIGFWGGFLWSLLLSPIIGLIIALLSKSKNQAALEHKAFQNLAHPQQPQIQQTSIADELTKLEDLRSKNLVSEDEYQRMRQDALKRHGM